MSHKFEILMVIEGEIATTQITERLLISLESCEITYKKRLFSELQESDFSTNTLPLFIRSSDPSLVYWADFLKRANHPYFYYIDDNFWLIKGDSGIAKYYQDKLVRKSLEYIVTRANTVLVNSIELADFIVSFNSNIQILIPSVDFSLINENRHKKTDEIRIGFAGSTSRVDDLNIIAPVVTKIINEFPHVVFEFAGAMPRNVLENDRVRFFPYINNYSDYFVFQMGRQWDIGLSPLVDNASNRCKTNNKYREYGACGIAGIYSNIPLYKRSVHTGVTGIIVENTSDAWLVEIRRLIENSTLREEICKNARADVLATYSTDVVKMSWLKSIKQLANELQFSKINNPRNKYKQFIIKCYLKLFMVYQINNKMDFLKILGSYFIRSIRLGFRKIVNLKSI